MTGEPAASAPADAPLRSARPPAARRAPAGAWPDGGSASRAPCLATAAVPAARSAAGPGCADAAAPSSADAAAREHIAAHAAERDGWRAAADFVDFDADGAAARLDACELRRQSDIPKWARRGLDDVIAPTVVVDERQPDDAGVAKPGGATQASGPDRRSACTPNAARAMCTRCDWAAGAEAAGRVAGEVGASGSGGGAAKAGEPPTACADANARPVPAPADGELPGSVMLAGADDDTAPAQRSEHELEYGSALPLPGGSDAAAASGARDASGHAEVVAPEVVPASRCTAQIIEVTRNPIAEQQLTLLEGKFEGFALPLMRLR